MTSSDKITVQPYHADQAAEWGAFLADSNNGTIFHDLNFLAYHSPGRFDFQHLIMRRNGDTVALLPGAVVSEPDGRRFLKSPCGASVGGPVLPCGAGAETVLKIVARLQAWASDAGLDGIEMRLGPPAYCRYPDDTLGFALAASGFKLTLRWLSHVIPLPPEPADVLNGIRHGRRRRYVRSALRRGIVVSTAGAERLPQFYRVLEENRAKHSARPTHTLEELKRIFELVPGRVRLFVCERQGDIMSGSVVFELNDRVAYTFYICHDERFEQYRPAMVVAVGVAEHYATRGFSYLDLGPSTFADFSLNSGLATFKEDLGGRGFCRDAWRWERDRGGSVE